jgi:ribulose-phosphate 3-epimerase
MITFHAEACLDPSAVIKHIRSFGKKAGVSIKPGTGLSAIEGLLNDVDMVLIMTVEPGFGGQSFMENMTEKIMKLRTVFGGLIQVDGGINTETARQAVMAGTDVLVAGTAVFGEKDYKKAIRAIRNG